MLALCLSSGLALGYNGIGLFLGLGQQLLAEAQKQADAIVAEGKAAAEAERQHKLREADAQTTALARAMCEKLLSRNLTEQDDSRLLDDLLEKAGAEHGN